MKLTLLQQWIHQNQVEMFACTELGTCWDMVKYEERLPHVDGGKWCIGF